MRRFTGLVIDLLFVALATIAAVVIRDNLEVLPEHLWATVPYTLASVGSALIVLTALRAYKVLWRFSSLNDYLRLIVATVVIVGGASLCSFVLNRSESIPRSLPVLQAMLIVAFLIGARVFRRIHYSAKSSTPPVRQVELSMPSVGGGERTVLIVGLTRLTDLYIRSVAEFAPRSIRIAGLLGQKEKFIGASVHQHTVLGIPEDVASIVKTLEVHGVFVDSIVIAKRFDALSPRAQQALLQLEASTTIRLILLPDSLGFDAPPANVAAQAAESEVDQVAFTYSDAEIRTLYSRPHWRIKRAIDVLAAAALLVLAAPVMLIAAILVAIDMGMPVCFWQQRPGRGGRPIRLYKFRTMRAPHDSNGRRLSDSERSSVVGRFLRRTRLDELPQLFSILSGEMSFVGPRPLLPIDQAPEYAARLLVSPGLTGWAQINGGREISAVDKAALDIWYVQNASLMLDLLIILKTIPMVIFGERKNQHYIQRAWSDLQNAGICSYRRTGGVVSIADNKAVRAA